MNVAAIIILYHPDEAHLHCMLQTIAQMGWSAILVDNSPHSLPPPQQGSAHYIHCPGNVGIAEAQNQGIDAAITKNAESVLVLDQDSQLSVDFLSALHSAFQLARQRYPNLACIGPQIHCEFTQQTVNGRVSREKPLCEQLSEVRQIIASGMLIPVTAFQQIGKKDSALFIDGVDHEWCWRAQQKGFKVLKANQVVMPHRQGDARQRILGVNFKQGAPVRLYYQVRNVLILSRRNYVPVYWKCRQLLALPVRWLANRWFFPEGRLRGRFMWHGLRDGLAGRSGKYHDNS